MKIHSLEIKNIRGIPDLRIKPSKQSLVIYGPNGSGKSAVIDAIDFLLTGRIARLVGEGTDGVSLKSHGPHIDQVADLSKVEVIAEIQIGSVNELISISRKMSQPSRLIYDSKYESRLASVLELLDRGQHVFTRRELLKLITAKASTRAQEIQKVLKLGNLEAIRKNLVSVFNEARKEDKAAFLQLDNSKKGVISITGYSVYDKSETLKFVNEQRKILGGLEIIELESSTLQKDIAPIQSNVKSVNHIELNKRVGALKQAELSSLFIEAKNADEQLRITLKSIREDAQANWDSARHQLTKDGIELIRKSGECPLCDVDWKDGELKEFLQTRVETQSERQEKLSSNAKIVSQNANDIIIKISQLNELISAVKETERIKKSTLVKESMDRLKEWEETLSELKSALVKPLDTYVEEQFPSADIEKSYLPSSMDAILDNFEKEIEKLFPEATPEQTAWDNLTKLTERIRLVEEGQFELSRTATVRSRATILGQSYVIARDEVLDRLYDKIKLRFVGLYREMHSPDEKDFEASFTPQDAGLNLEVDFYGRGQHPPQAMHSEGHQDSMGVCLFLALSEHLNTGLVDLVILDDVVMSIDIGHRREFCNLLASNFNDKQFIITTHDTTWANQLRSEGLVNRKQMLKFSDWSVTSGPTIHYEADMWNRINEDLKNNDVTSASAKLRNGLEEFTRFVCHNLRAKVPYTLDDGGSFGDFLFAAISTHNNLLDKAIKAEESWERETSVTFLKKRKKRTIELINQALGEQVWINKTVHYNYWAKLGKEDFIPVVVAFHELCESVFACNIEGCNSVLKVTFDGPRINGVRCKCGANNWNLIKK